MRFFGRHSDPEPPAVRPRPRPIAAKGVEWSGDHADYFQRNLIMVRTVSSESFGGGSYGMMYRRQPAVRAVVDFLARNVAQLNAKVYERLDNTDRLEVGDHPLAVLLRKPNPMTTRYAHMRDTVSDLAIYDRAYWRKINVGRTLAVVRIPPAAVTIEPTAQGRVYRIGKLIVPRSQLVVFAGYSPDGDGDGVSPLETLRRVLEEESAAQVNRQGMWLNSARQSGFIERPLDAPEWSDDARQRFRTDVEATLAGGSNAGRIGVLEEGMRWNASSFSPEQTQYIQGRRLTYEEVAVAYGVPPSIIGMGATETKSNAEQFHRQVYQDVLGPWLRMLQDEIELQLLAEFEPFSRKPVYVEFNLAAKLKGSFEEEGRTLVTTVGVPIMSPNEGRARLNLPRIDDPAFDRPIQPLNVMYGGQPAVTIPTADPGTAAAPLALVKASGPPPGALRRRDSAAKEHVEVLRKLFERQERSVLSAKGKSDHPRWDRELTADLYLLATQVTRHNGKIAAQQIGGVYDEPRTLPYLAENARIAAEAINAHTFALIDAAEDADELRAVFEVAKGSRAEQIALGRAVMLIGFARTEAAKHTSEADGRKRTKTWIATTSHSRHADMNGETVDVGANFSNGLPFPGSVGAGADEVAGCHCLLSINA